MKKQRKLPIPKGGHRWCEKHGKRYLLIPDLKHHHQTGACAHPDCIDAQINALCSYKKKPSSISRIWGWINRKGLVEDFRSFLIMRMLREVSHFDRPAILNYTLLRYSMLKYINIEHRKGGKPPVDYQKEQPLPKQATKQGNIRKELKNIVRYEPSRTQNSFGEPDWSNPEDSFIAQEIKMKLTLTFGKEIVACFLDEISLFEASKLTKKSIAEVREEVLRCRTIAKGYWEESV